MRVSLGLEEWCKSQNPKMPNGQVSYSTNVSLKNKFLYIETPKVGCSTIKATLQYLENDKSSKDIVFKDMDTVHKRRLSVLSSLDKVGDIPSFLARGDIFKFCFVRNPYTRIYSAYKDKITVRTSRQKREVLKLLGKEIDGVEHISFETFVKCIVDVPPRRMNPHWRIQYFQTMQNIVKFDFIGRFENFNDDFKYVLNRIYMNSNSQQIDLRPHRTDTSEKYKSAYSNELQKLVYEKFKQDFDFFGYSDEL